MKTASPGATSRTSLKPSMSSATLSDASIHSVPLRRLALAEHQRADAIADRGSRASRGR